MSVNACNGFALLIHLYSASENLTIRFVQNEVLCELLGPHTYS